MSVRKPSWIDLLACGLVAAGWLLSPFIVAGHAADVTLIEKGRTRTKIFATANVMAAEDENVAALKNPLREREVQRQRLRESVKDLAHYLEKMSGAAVEIVTEPPVPGETPFPILIGELAEERFGPAAHAPFNQGFRMVVAEADGVGLFGESDLATSYAIYELLDRLGCRWYMSGEMGEVIPTLATIAIEETDFSGAPGTTYRGLWAVDAAYCRRNRHRGVLLSAGNALEMYVTDEQREAHPEWKAEIGGKPHHHRLRWSNAALAETIGDKIIADYEANLYPSFSLSPNDGADFDESAEDKAIDAGDFDNTCQMPAITDRLMVFTNRVADRVSAKHPDVLFGVLAYVNYTRPPIREKVHPNVVPQIAPITYSRAHPMTDDRVPGNSDLRGLIEGWGKSARQTSVYFYGWFLAEPSAPNPMIKKWSVDVPIVLANGCRFWQPETLNNFETSMHALYLGCRLAWDPKLEPAEIIAELNTKFYGNAAAEMTAYWNHVDRAWVDTPEYSGCGFGYLRRWTPEVMAESRRLMNAGLAACQTPEERFRVQLADDSLSLFELFMQLRLDQAEGRFEHLSADAATWREQVVSLGEKYKDQHAFTRTGWTPHTVNGAYFAQFYGQTYDDANRIARDYSIITPPLRSWRYQLDKEKAGESLGYAAPDFDDSAWKTTDPCLETWSTLGFHDYFGSMWYRTEVELPVAPVPKKTWLWIGATDGSVKVFVNGRHVPFVNAEGKTAPDFTGYCQAASFDVTDAIVPGGTNTISLFCTRTIFNELGTGGLLSPVVLYQEKP